MTDTAALRPHLPERGRAKIDGIYRDRRRAFRAAVTFVGPDAEMVFKRLRNTFRQFLRAGHDEAQAAKVFRRAPAGASVQEGWRCQEHGHRVFVDEPADPARLQRIRVKHDSAAGTAASCSPKPASLATSSMKIISPGG